MLESNTQRMRCDSRPDLPPHGEEPRCERKDLARPEQAQPRLLDSPGKLLASEPSQSLESEVEEKKELQAHRVHPQAADTRSAPQQLAWETAAQVVYPQLAARACPSAHAGDLCEELLLAALYIAAPTRLACCPPPVEGKAPHVAGYDQRHGRGALRPLVSPKKSWKLSERTVGSVHKSSAQLVLARFAAGGRVAVELGYNALAASPAALDSNSPVGRNLACLACYGRGFTRKSSGT
mmetsp:Transcript_60342/g.160520  ORF Transcript_60342/g.160520 Transcript_60342/m.160520 type:complete len:237 (+) Transcript_60342:636-1346(+)